MIAPNPRPGIIDDAWWAAATRSPGTVPGISIERHDLLRRTDVAYGAWWAALRPALYYCIRLEPLDESLRRWRCYRLSIAPPRVYLASIVHTPAGSPDWLVELEPWEPRS